MPSGHHFQLEWWFNLVCFWRYMTECRDLLTINLGKGPMSAARAHSGGALVTKRLAPPSVESRIWPTRGSVYLFFVDNRAPPAYTYVVYIVTRLQTCHIINSYCIFQILLLLNSQIVSIFSCTSLVRKVYSWYISMVNKNLFLGSIWRWQWIYPWGLYIYEWREFVRPNT